MRCCCTSWLHDLPVSPNNRLVGIHMLLAIDTSTRLAGIALYDSRRGLIAEYTWHSANRHTVELMPAIDRMMTQSEVTPAALCAIAVAIGPGSFTGLRVALAAAKGLSLAYALPLLGVPTLDVVAYPHHRQPLPVVAVVQAGRGRVCWARYPAGTTTEERPRSYELATIAELGERIAGENLIAGELFEADRAALQQTLGARATLLLPALSLPRPGFLAELGWQRYEAGERDDVATLSPIYLHDPIHPAGSSTAKRER